MHRFYTTEKIVLHTELALSKEESNHLARVLRLDPGKQVEVFDGKGAVARATVLQVSSNKTLVRIESVTVYKEISRVHVAFAVAKSHALDFIIHRCTEVGVASLTPLITKFSLNPSNWNDDRWKKVLIEVCKQCQLNIVPEIKSPTPLESWIKTRNPQNILLFCDEDERKGKEVFVPHSVDVDILVGAEGGWSDPERAMVRGAGAIPFGLGANRLRAETATLVATVLAKKLSGEIQV